MTEIDQVQIVGHLARVLQEPYGIDYNDLLDTSCAWCAAASWPRRVSFVESLDKDVALVDDIMRRWSELVRYQNIQADDKQVAQFLADQSFRAPLQRPRRAHPRRAGRPPAEAPTSWWRPFPAWARSTSPASGVARAAKRDKQEIWRLGGLHVVGSERHESRRIDNQLRGRAARQGDPGSSRFFLSLEDDLMKRFGGERLKGFMSVQHPRRYAHRERMLDQDHRKLAGAHRGVQLRHAQERRRVRRRDEHAAPGHLQRAAGDPDGRNSRINGASELARWSIRTSSGCCFWMRLTGNGAIT
jgi:hypothetical protein